MNNLQTSGGALVADLCVRRICSPKSVTLFDIRVADTKTQSYRDHSPIAIFSTAEHDKKQKYTQACQYCKASYLLSPVCMS